jgi:serine/threonine-protein phosphatase 6 regulatory ankyrin repeat subunit B
VKTAKILAKSDEESCATGDDFKYTPLLLAAANGRVDIARVLLENGASVGRTNHKAWTALHVAAFHGQLEVCRLLLEKGAEVNAIDLPKKNTPLHSAARNGYLSVVQLLVERGANVRTKNTDGQTASGVARLKGHPNVSSWLHKLY